MDVLGTALLLAASLAQAGPPGMPDTLDAAAEPLARFEDARAVAADPFGVLYVVDAGRHAVVRLDEDGLAGPVLGGPGRAGGAFDEPADIDPTNGLVLLVADEGNGRVQRFSREFAFLGAYLVEPEGPSEASPFAAPRREAASDPVGSGRPAAVASSRYRDVYALDVDAPAVVHWEPEGRLAGRFGLPEDGPGALARPIDLALVNAFVYVADPARGGVLVYDLNGTFVRRLPLGDAERVRALAPGPHGLVIVYADRLVSLGEAGRPVQVLRPGLDEPLVDAVWVGSAAFVLTSKALYRLRVP